MHRFHALSICTSRADSHKVSRWQSENIWHWTEKPQLCHPSWTAMCVCVCAAPRRIAWCQCLTSIPAITVLYVLKHCVSCVLLCLGWTGAWSRGICRTGIVFSSALSWNRKTFAQHPAFLNLFKDGVTERCPVTCPVLNTSCTGCTGFLSFLPLTHGLLLRESVLCLSI